MDAEMTDWFPAGAKPKRKGVYEMEPGADQILGGSLGRYQQWNGKFWCSYSSSIASAADTFNRSSHQNRRWRGFVKKQKGAA